MPGRQPKTAKQTNTKESDQCVLLIEAEAEVAVKLLRELDSATGERLHVEWVTELSSGVERLRNGGIAAVVLDLILPDSHGIETFDRIFQAAPLVPILILSEADTEEMARQAVLRGGQDYVFKNHPDSYRLRQAMRAMMDRRVVEAISVENEFANGTLDSIEEAVVRIDINGNINYLNHMAEKLTGWPRNEALARPIADVLHFVDAVSGELIPTSMELIAEEENSAKITGNCMNCVLVRRDGVEFGIESIVTPINGQDGDITGTVVAFHDVTMARARSVEMSHLAHHDFLTELPNRMLFNDRLTQSISLAVRQDKQLAVMFVDLDQFKQFNDSLGHEVGDKLLRSVAMRLVSCVRRTDTVCRLGGDEFVVLLSQVEHEEDAAFSARKILRALAVPHRIDNKSLDITASIGVSTYPSDGPDAETLMNRADTAMYEVKKRGRNNFQFFRQDMGVRLAERQLLEGDLRSALGRNEFLLHYQPKISLQTGRITGMEALIRWSHPQKGLIPPAEFIPIAEGCGLMIHIGQWVLLEACRQSRAWTHSGLNVPPMAVNVSATEFEDKDFLSGVRAALISTGLEPPNLELELTESVLMRDPDSTVNILGAMKAMGVQLAIDDFGTGYSSFTYLRRFSVDALKLHQSFVQEIAKDSSDASIVDVMINIGNSQKLRVVAEGVETREQFQFLQQNGCGEGQGYYFSRPLVANQARELLGAGLKKGTGLPFEMP